MLHPIYVTKATHQAEYEFAKSLNDKSVKPDDGMDRGNCPIDRGIVSILHNGAIRVWYDCHADMWMPYDEPV